MGLIYKFIEILVLLFNLIALFVIVINILAKCIMFYRSYDALIKQTEKSVRFSGQLFILKLNMKSLSNRIVEQSGRLMVLLFT